MGVVGIVSYRLGGADGVSIEAEKWAWALERLGWSVRRIAGSGPDGVQTVGGIDIVPAGEVDTAALHDALADCDLVIVENLCSLPLNPAAGRAVADALRGRPAIMRHHDLAWQRPDTAHLGPPPDDPAWRLPVVYQIALCHERLGNVDRARLVYQDIMDATKTNAPADLAELGRMAAWRMGNLDWNNSIRHQVTGIFETTTGRTAPVAAPAKNPASP